MQHQLPIGQLGPCGELMAEAVQACVHCGFCLPTCPTYQVLGQEMDSPRGRIYLMKEMLQGDLQLGDMLEHIDRCLGCLACETACPSGVRYRELISPFRERAERQRHRRWLDRLRRQALLATLPSAWRFRGAVNVARLARPMRNLLPGRLRLMLDLLPQRLPKSATLPDVTAAIGRRRARVALLRGCVQQVIAPEINRATIEVLARNGVEVLVPPDQACCGALAWHVGAARDARQCARQNVAAFGHDVDAIVTNAAGCGSTMREYAAILRGEDCEADGRATAEKVRDAAEFLDALGLVDTPPALPRPVKLAYHDACHLAHGQSVRAAPRRLLAAVGNVELVELNDGEICCGSAGTYNLDQPAIAAALGRRKAEAVARTDADAVVAGNVGCMVQIAAHLRNVQKKHIEVVHTMQVLAAAYAGRDPITTRS